MQSSLTRRRRRLIVLRYLHNIYHCSTELIFSAFSIYAISVQDKPPTYRSTPLKQSPSMTNSVRSPKAQGWRWMSSDTIRQLSLLFNSRLEARWCVIPLKLLGTSVSRKNKKSKVGRIIQFDVLAVFSLLAF